MDNGSGWLVTQSGQWVPVAYNASISESMPFRRASFTSLSGSRTVASRGRGPREWEVEEDVIYDWAQALSVLYNSVDADEPMYWISPLAARSNYAINKTYNWQNKDLSDARVRVEDGKAGSEMMAAEGNIKYITEPFPVHQGVRVSYGAGLSTGGVYIHWIRNGKGVSASRANQVSDTNKVSSRTQTLISSGITAAALYVSGPTLVTSPFVRIGDDPDFLGVDGTGSEGAWVTLEDVEINHKAISRYNPITTVKFTLKECKAGSL